MQLHSVIPKSDIPGIEAARDRIQQSNSRYNLEQSQKKIREKTNKYTYVQNYEDQQQAFWSSMIRNKDIYNYNEFFYAMSKHPAVYAVVNKIVENMFKGGYEIVPNPEVKNPSEKMKVQLEMYLKNVHPDGLTFLEIMKDAWSDVEPCGTKLVQIDKEYPYLYGNLDFGTFKPNLNENGLFMDGWKWEQIIFGQVRAQLYEGEFIWYRLPGKNTLIYPRSPLEPLLMGIETDLFGKAFNNNRFTNSSSFGSIIILPDLGDEQDAKAMSNYINQNYVTKSTTFGAITTDNSYKPLVLYGGASIDQSIVDRFKDMDFVKLRGTTIEDVCMVWNMPLRVMGIEKAGLGAAGANDTAMRQFYDDLIIPRQQIWETQTNKQLILDRLGCTDWILRLIKPKWINEKDEIISAGQMIKDGIQSKHEARFQLKGIHSYLGHDFDKGIELQDWDKPANGTDITSANVLSGGQIKEAVNIVTQVGVGSLPRDSALGQLIVMFNLTENQANQILGSIKEGSNKPQPKMVESTVIEESEEEENRMSTIRAAADIVRKSWNYRMVENDLDAGEESIQEQFDIISNKMFKDAVKQSIAAWRKGDLMFTVKVKYKADMDSLLRKESAVIFEDGRKDVKSQMGTRSYRAVNLDSLNKYKQLVKKESKQASEKWYKELETLIDIEYNQAIRRKLSENDFIDNMQQSFDKKMNKSPTIVRTMTTGFYNSGRIQMMYEVGDFVEYVQFSAIMDDRTSERCLRLDGTIMRKDGNIEKIEPPLHFNCRSLILPITQEDVKKQSKLSTTTPNKKINNILNNTPGFDRV